MRFYIHQITWGYSNHMYSANPCWGNDNRLGQVFINIIRNAMDAMQSGGTLTVGIRKVQARAKVTFADTGAGMPQELISKIFDPFFTTKQRADTNTHGGTGLGLSLCREIVEEHGGTIDVQSSPGQGTRFAVSLPILADQAPHEDAPEAKTSIPPGATVLVADDEPDIGEMVRMALELNGAVVVAVQSGEEALEL